MRSLTVDIPKRMRTLERDPRGYPVPFIVLRDKKKQPMFTINDVSKTTQCRTLHLCSICGRRLDKFMWFVGGSRCFIHDHGAFVDPPVHYECGMYALQVCPFLAAPSYNKRIDEKKLKPENRPDNMRLVTTNFMPPAQPELFGIGACILSVFADNVYVVPHWQYVEWWHTGQPCNAPTADDIRRLTADLPSPQLPKGVGVSMAHSSYSSHTTHRERT
jgi:hypothetical protein